MNLNIGDKVRWRSQAGSVWRTKEGTVIAVVPAGERPKEVSGCGYARDHVSYVIKATADNGSPRQRKYWPIVSKLERLETPVAEPAL